MKKRRSPFSILNFRFSIPVAALAASFASATVAPGFLGVCEHVNDDGENFFYRTRAYNVAACAGAT